MPVTYEVDQKTGRIKRVGSPSGSDGTAVAKPPTQRPATTRQQPAIGQRAVLNGRAVVWSGPGWGWQSPATYSRTKAAGNLDTQRNPMNWLNNNLAHLLKTSNSLNNGTRLVGTAGFLPIYEEPSGRFSSATPAQRQVAHATTAQPLANAGLAVVNLGQRVISGQPFKATDPESSPVGRAIRDWNRGAAVAMGARLPEQLTPDQKALLSDMPSSFATNTALAFAAPLRAAGMGLGGAMGGVVGRLPFVSPAMQQVLTRGLQWGGVAGVNEAASGILDDSTQGQAGDLLKAMGAPVPGAFLTNEGDDRISAGLKGILPGMVLGEVPGIAFGAATKTVEFAPNALRNLRERRLRGEAQAARQTTVEAGIQEVDPQTGEHRFTQQVTTQPAPAVAAPAPVADVAAGAAPAQGPTTFAAAAEQKLGPRPGAAAAEATPAAAEAPAVPTQQWADPTAANADMGRVQEGTLPEADPGADPWYDPALPEIDAAAIAVNRLDDDQLKAVAQAEGPVLPQLEQTLASQPAPEVDGALSTERVAAPTEALADPVVGYSEQWQLLPTARLQGMAHPEVSPDLFERVQGLTGRDWEQFTRADVLDGLEKLRQDGLTVMPSRVQDSQRSMPIGQIAVDPVRLQFKGGTDAQGRQRGNSLEGVNKWNPDSEGVIQTWTDPENGVTYVVNGHNRLAKARELGIPTLRTEELLASTAEQARAQGAIANISSGGGTVFDAAKFLRDSGVQDPVRLQQLGIPLDSGFGTRGLALSKLPDNIFQAALDGRISEGKAAALGGSGLDETQMQAAYKALQGQDLTDGEFGEVLQQARNAPVVQGQQVDLFGNTETLSLMVQKAQLAAAIRRDLVGDKNLFGRVGRNAKRLQSGGNQINATGSKAVAMDAQTLLGEFDATKYAAETPVSTLLNQGAIEIANGAKPGVVAKRILQQLANAARDTKVDLTQVAASLGTPEELMRVGLGASRVRQLAELDPARLQQEIEVARERLGRDRAAAAARGAGMDVDPDTREAAQQYGLNPREVAKWQAMAPEELDQLAVKWQEQVLTDRKLQNRQAKKAELEKQMDAVAEYTDELPGSGSPRELSQEEFDAKWGTDEAQYPVMPKAADVNRLDRELGRHDEAVRALSWYEEHATTRPLTPEQRQDLKAQVLARAASNGEVRPSATPMLETPEGPAVDVNAAIRDLQEQLETTGQVAPGTPAAQLIEDEVRLGEVYSQRDAVIQQEVARAQREAMGYDDLPFQERVAKAGLAEGWELPPVPERGLTTEDAVGLDDRAALARQQREAAEAAGDQEAAAAWREEERRLERSRIANAQAGMDASQQGLFGVGQYDASTPLLGQAEAPAPAPVLDFTLPADLAGAKPRYGYGERNFQVELGSDFDRAAYVLAGDANGASRKANAYRAALERAGYDLKEVVAHGQQVKAALKEAARTAGDANDLALPAVPFAGQKVQAVEVTIVPAQPVAAVEIPAGASRAITAKTDASRVQGAAESLLSWANNGVPGERQAIRSLDQALDLVRAKGAILDPDKIPGLAMDAARNEKAMGRSTADTEAVAQAYRQFYGLEQAGPGISRVEVKANPKVADIFEGLSNALFESDKRLFDKADKLRGLTQKAIRELEAGDTTRALQEAAALGEQRAADLKAQIETIKQRAIEEGC